jgi:hypothetical protein
MLKLIREIQVWKNKFEFPEKVFCFVPDKNQKSKAQKKQLNNHKELFINI